MTARTLPAASPQAADGQAAVAGDDTPGGLTALCWTPAGHNVIVAGATSGHHPEQAGG